MAKSEMATIHITAYPYATVYGDLKVPDEVMNGSDKKLHEYIEGHWSDIEFSDPELDFQGCDYEFE